MLGRIDFQPLDTPGRGPMHDVIKPAPSESTNGVPMPYVTTTENCKLYVKDWGNGRPVVMMHGWPLSSDSFDDLSMAIAGSRRSDRLPKQ